MCGYGIYSVWWSVGGKSLERKRSLGRSWPHSVHFREISFLLGVACSTTIRPLALDIDDQARELTFSPLQCFDNISSPCWSCVVLKVRANSNQ